MKFQEKSYKKHENIFEKKYKKDIDQKFNCVFKKNTVFRWKFERIMKNLESLFSTFPQSKWMTIGDGKFGADAEYIQSKNINVIATDISDYLLKYSKKNKKIKNISKENAENISFNDNFIDFTFCKEAYHHFPRPYLAIYEMIRVSKKGIVLIEPTDYMIDQSILKQIILKIFDPIFKKLGIKITQEAHEPVGNYIYRISEREIQKISLGFNLPFFAIKRINDYNWKSKKANYQEILNNKSKTYKKIKKMINFLNFLTRAKLLSGNLTIAIIFKENLTNHQIRILNKTGFKVVRNPKNPYIK